MAEFKLERFKYNWRGTWVNATDYKRDDVVRVNGKTYVCLVTHTSNQNFTTDLTAILPGSNPPQPQPKWIIMTGGKYLVGEYQELADYNLGDVVFVDGSLWTCIVPYTSSVGAIDLTKWQAYVTHIEFLGDWATTTSYSTGGIVKYNGINYKCVLPHVSGATLEENSESWKVINNNVEYRGEWTGSTEYRKNDLVKYGGTVFRCTETHTANSTNLDDNYFTVEFFGSQYNSDWDNTVYYNVGDLVRYRGFIYYAVQNNNNSTPYVDSDTGSEDWILLSRSTYFVGDWTLSGEYKPGDIVLRGGNLYLALRDISQFSQDGSSADYLDDNTWELIIPGTAWKDIWTAGNTYSINDVVYYKGTTYKCNFEHDSELQNRPGDNGNEFLYWDIFVQGGDNVALQAKGDLLTYGLSNELEGEADGSTLGNKRILIGEDEQLLSVNSKLEAYWRDITFDADVVYVSLSGLDAPNRGTFEKPFRTIRYACEYVEDTFDPLTPVIVRASTGRFEEIGPIVVPAGCAVEGDELRSTTILASGPIAAYQGDLPYVVEYFGRLEEIILPILTGVAIEPTVGNTATQITLDNFVTTPTIISYPVSDVTAAAKVIELYNAFEIYADFYINSGPTSPEISGGNTLTDDTILTNAYRALELNKEFIQQELLAYLKLNNPTYSIVDQRVINDIECLLRGIIKDIKYSGNYYTLVAAQRYVSATLGSQTGDLFRMRDSTGLRNCTTGGLTGVLRPPEVFELYQRPTGGACVALDPGWGPDDESTWIVNRSPYIQGVTNTGTGCVGKKVDGSLHNGGNRSMVSNDFTQVLSDGVGIWVSENARTELVSVFTYYCAIGYFAENGGQIRATNGNNSYGKYGSISDGADATETPQEVTIFNRNNEAIVKSAIAGGNADEIFIFEYENAGQEYTVADANIKGAGANADIEYSTFRDGGIAEAKLTKTLDQSGTKGGSGYLVRAGAAQETLGATSTIKLSANDVTQTVDEIIGMRLIITDGTGVGQYGLVSTFDFITKEVEVIKESTGVAGWDHIIPGYPLVTNLDLTTRYRIEPRVTVTPPGFESLGNYQLFANRTYTGLEWQNTKETFTNLSTASSIPFVDDNGDAVTISSIISGIQLQLSGVFAQDPRLPIQIKGNTSEATATIEAISANTGSILEVEINAGGNSFEEGESLTVILVAGTGNTFDDEPIAATFDVVRIGSAYTVTLNQGGAGYKAGDKLTIAGTRVGGETPDNDITITVGSVTDDSSASILTFTYLGTSIVKRFVALTNAEYFQYSDNGINWTEGSLPYVGDYRALMSSPDGKFIGLANNTSVYVSSETGATWETKTLPFTASWVDGIYGSDKFIIVADDDSRILTSLDGETWTSRLIPDDTGGDGSTISQWSHIAYGAGIFVVVSQNDGATATSTDGGITWVRHDEVIPVLVPAFNPVGVVYGDNRFIILDSEGRTYYSFDGATWYEGNTLPGGLAYKKIKYGNGNFFAVGTDVIAATNIVSTSDDGIIWNEYNTVASQIWGELVYSNLNDTSTWVLLANAAQSAGVEHIKTGKTARLRADVSQGVFDSIKIWDPGSGYYNDAIPTISVIDPNEITSITPLARLGSGVLPQPDFINRGAGYRTSSSTIRITGDGFADIIPEANQLVVSGVRSLPGPGVQIRIAGNFNLDTEDDLTDLNVYSGVSVTDLGDDGSGNGTRLVQFQISPKLTVEDAIQHGTATTLRERYSQCRLTGHDFLDIGTGNFTNTNYPDIYAGGDYFVALPENEVFETNGGRIYYTSTDQDGNFRTGELFAVQQSTGIVTISAQFFDLDGLSELSLGGVRLGGSGTVVNEFSTDPTFLADSNSVIPTQRAIATFLANRLSVGGENLEVNRLVAGRLSVGGEDDGIFNVTGEYILVPTDVKIDGTYTDSDEVVRPSGISGTIISQMFLLEGIDDTMQ